MLTLNSPPTPTFFSFSHSVSTCFYNPNLFLRSSFFLLILHIFLYLSLCQAKFNLTPQLACSQNIMSFTTDQRCFFPKFLFFYKNWRWEKINCSSVLVLWSSFIYSKYRKAERKRRLRLRRVREKVKKATTKFQSRTKKMREWEKKISEETEAESVRGLWGKEKKRIWVFRVRFPQNNVVLGWEKCQKRCSFQSQHNRPITGSTVPVTDFTVKPTGFLLFQDFSYFSVFDHNWTGLVAGSWLNRPVRSGF